MLGAPPPPPPPPSPPPTGPALSSYLNGLKFTSLHLLHAAIRGCDLVARADTAARVPSFYPCRTLALREALATVLGHVPISGVSKTVTTTAIHPDTGAATTTTTTLTISAGGAAGEGSAHGAAGASAAGEDETKGTDESPSTSPPQPWDLPTSRLPSTPTVDSVRLAGPPPFPRMREWPDVATVLAYVRQALAVIDGRDSALKNKIDVDNLHAHGLWRALEFKLAGASSITPAGVLQGGRTVRVISGYGGTNSEKLQLWVQMEMVFEVMHRWVQGALHGQLHEVERTCEVLNKLVHHHPGSDIGDRLLRLQADVQAARDHARAEWDKASAEFRAEIATAAEYSPRDRSEWHESRNAAWLVLSRASSASARPAPGVGVGAAEEDAPGGELHCLPPRVHLKRFTEGGNQAAAAAKKVRTCGGNGSHANAF